MTRVLSEASVNEKLGSPKSNKEPIVERDFDNIGGLDKAKNETYMTKMCKTTTTRKLTERTKVHILQTDKQNLKKQIPKMSVFISNRIAKSNHP